MSVSGIHTHYGVYLNDTAPTLIGGISRQNIATNSEVKGEVTSGEVYRRFLALYSQKIAPGFTTYAVASALGAIGVLGANIADLATGLEMFAQKYLDGSTRAGTLAHRKFGFTKGIIVPRRLSCDHRGDATIDYEVVVVHDGTNDPVVITDLVTLPSGITDAERFTLGPSTIGGVTVAGKTRFSIDFGIDAVGESADSDIWDTLASIRSVQSELTIESLDVELFKAANVPLVGKAATHLNTTIYLRKRAVDGTFVADATTEHIELTACGLIVPDDAFTSDGQTPGKVSFKMPLRYDGTNVPLIIDTAAALPA